MKTTVDIIIPTLLTQYQVLKECLNSISKADHENLRVHVYIVCNTKQTPAHTSFFQSYQKAQLPFVLDWIWLGTNKGFAEAMNKGFEVSTGELVFCLNDDTTLDRSCLEQLVLTQQQTGADMVASTILLSNSKKIDSKGFTFWWRGKATALETNPKNEVFPNESVKDHWLNNTHFFDSSDKYFFAEPFGPDAAACLYTRNLLNKTNAFRTSFFAYLEDVDLALRARKLGMYCVLANNAVVYHHKHTTSGKWKNFKTQRDLLNWWRICMGSYPKGVWQKYWLAILLERARNFNGFVKAYF